MKRNAKGFTLIELLIVVAIIGIIAAIAIPNFISYRDKTYCSAAQADAQAIASAIADYFATPPNAIVYGTGYVSLSEMVRNGFVLQVVSALIVVVLFYFVLPSLSTLVTF